MSLLLFSDIAFLINFQYTSKSLSQDLLSEETQTGTAGPLESTKHPFKLGFKDWITHQSDGKKV